MRSFLALLNVAASLTLAFILWRYLLRIPFHVSLMLIAVISAAILIWIIRRKRVHWRYRRCEPFSGRVSVIVPAKDEEEVIRETLLSLSDQDYGNYEVIVVNDGSVDGTEDVVREFCDKYENFKLINIPRDNEIHGKAHAISLGFEKASGEIVGVLDADVRVPRDYLKEALRPFSIEEISGVQTAIKGWWRRANVVSFISYYDLEFTNLFMTFFLPGRSFGTGFFMRKKDFEKAFPLEFESVSDDEQINMFIFRNHLKVVYAPWVWLREHVTSDWRVLLRQRRRWFTGMIMESIRDKGPIGFLYSLSMILIDLAIWTIFTSPVSFPSLVLMDFVLLSALALLIFKDDFGIESVSKTILGTLISYLINLAMINYAIFKSPFFSRRDISWQRTPRV